MMELLIFFYISLVLILTAVLVYRRVATKGVTDRLIVNWLKVLSCGLLGSTIPLLHVGLVFGLPSTLLASVLVAVAFADELS